MAFSYKSPNSFKSSIRIIPKLQIEAEKAKVVRSPFLKSKPSTRKQEVIEVE